MKKLIFPKNPNRNSPERRYTANERILGGIGGLAVCGASLINMLKPEQLTRGRNFLKLSAFIGGFIVFSVIAAEFSERFSDKADGEYEEVGEDGDDGEDGDGRGDWGDTDDPLTPNGPSDSGINVLVQEIEDFLQSQGSATV